MSSVTSLGFPFPGLTDGPNVPGDIQALATALNTYLVAQNFLWSAHQNTPSNLTTGTFTLVAMDTVDADPTSLGISSSGCVIPATGYYELAGVVQIASSTTGRRGGQIAKGGTGILSTKALSAVASNFMAIALPATLLACTAGDVITIQGFQESGGTVATVAGSSLMVKRVA